MSEPIPYDVLLKLYGDLKEAHTILVESLTDHTPHWRDFLAGIPDETPLPPESVAGLTYGDLRELWTELHVADAIEAGDDGYLSDAP